MSLHSDKNGQVMLTTAFLMAIILTLIALMLNNIVYYNNISYMGFMDHSGYDDVSIKNMVAEEAVFAYNGTHGNPGQFNAHMNDFIKSINNLTIPKGSYISFATSAVEPYAPTATYKSTESLLTIQTKDSKKTYSIVTNYTPPGTSSPPGPGSTPLNCKVYITANKTQMEVGVNDLAEVTVFVYDTSLNPLSGVTVDLHSSLGGFYDENGIDTLNPVVTKLDGSAVAYYFPTNIGIEQLNASVGSNPSRTTGNLSSNFTVQNQLSITSCTTHNVLIGTPGEAYSNNGKDYYVNISIPIQINVGTYNFNNLKAGVVYIDATSNNLRLIAPSDIINITEVGSVTGPGAYDKNVYVKLMIKNKNKAYKANIVVIVTGNCALDYGVLTKTEMFEVTGMYP